MDKDRKGCERDGPVRGLVLAGGGARGAYEVGVLRYIFEELPPDLMAKAPLRIFCGTSVGAIHATYLASTAHLPQHDIVRLVNLWRSLRIEKMLRLGPRHLLQLPRELRAIFEPNGRAEGILVNSQELTTLVAENMSWPALRRNLENGVVDALTVSATHIATGKTIVFADRPCGELPPWTRDRRVVVRPVEIGPAHALASASMPILFPPVKIDGAYYSDGGVRQSTPLSPALRLGADRVLIVGLRHAEDRVALQSRHQSDPDEDERFPSAFFLLGKVVDALMLDRIEYDLSRLEGFNMLLKDGEQKYGPDFIEHINRTAERMRGTAYRNVDTVIIRPSRDLGEMANEFIEVFRSRLGRMAGWVLGKISAADVLGDSDLLSYILFDGRLAEALIEMGRTDADASRQQLIDFFTD